MRLFCFVGRGTGGGGGGSPGQPKKVPPQCSVRLITYYSGRSLKSEDWDWNQREAVFSFKFRTTTPRTEEKIYRDQLIWSCLSKD